MSSRGLEAKFLWPKLGLRLENCSDINLATSSNSYIKLHLVVVCVSGLEYEGDAKIVTAALKAKAKLRP